MAVIDFVGLLLGIQVHACVFFLRHLPNSSLSGVGGFGLLPPVPSTSTSLFPSGATALRTLFHSVREPGLQATWPMCFLRNCQRRSKTWVPDFTMIDFPLGSR
jgi:hypothetical protein